MKLKKILPFAFLAFMLSGAIAQEEVVGPSPSSRTKLDLYESPGASQALRQINVSEAGLPLVIEDAQDAYHQVTIGEQKYWLRGMQVRIKRASTASCGLTAVSGQPSRTGSTPGIGKQCF